MESSSKIARVLVVGMLDSVHLGRFLQSVNSSELSIRLFPSTPHRRVHKLVRGVLDTQNGNSATISFFWKRFSVAFWFLDRILFNLSLTRATALRREIKSFNPDIIHALETQSGGYLLPRALSGIRGDDRPKVLLTLFGSDLYWYSRKPMHAKRLSMTLAEVDFLATECVRDHLLARSFGYAGQFLAPCPVAPYNISFPELVPKPADRRKILLKGYDNKWGRASVALEAISRCLDAVSDMEITIISAEGKVPRLAKKLLISRGAKVVIHKKNKLSREEVLDELLDSKLYVGVSSSDGLPSTLIEALAAGAFPIQSDTSCASDYLLNGENYIAIRDFNSSHEVERAIRHALSNPEMLAKSQETNLKFVRTLQMISVENSGLAQYKRVLAS